MFWLCTFLNTVLQQSGILQKPSPSLIIWVGGKLSAQRALHCDLIVMVPCKNKLGFPPDPTRLPHNYTATDITHRPRCLYLKWKCYQSIHWSPLWMHSTSILIQCMHCHVLCMVCSCDAIIVPGCTSWMVTATSVHHSIPVDVCVVYVFYGHLYIVWTTYSDIANPWAW